MTLGSGISDNASTVNLMLMGINIDIGTTHKKTQTDHTKIRYGSNAKWRTICLFVFNNIRLY